MMIKMKIKLDEFKRYPVEKGEVILYKSGGLFVVTYDDTIDERVWGFGQSPRKALHEAEHEWKRLIGGDNPFTFALQRYAERRKSVQHADT